MSETAQRRKQHGCEQPTDAGTLIAVQVDVGRVGDSGGCDGQTKHFGKAEGEDQTAKSPGENADAVDAAGLVDRVIRRIARPARAEPKDAGGEREHRASFCVPRVHREVGEFPGACELAQDDEEDNEAGDPGVEFVGMDDFVAEEGHQKGCGGDDDNARVARNVCVDSMEQLGAYDDVDRRPAHTGEDVEDGNWGTVSSGLEPVLLESQEV